MGPRDPSPALLWEAPVCSLKVPSSIQAQLSPGLTSPFANPVDMVPGGETVTDIAPRGPLGCPLPEGPRSACPPGCGEHSPHCPGLAFLEGDKIPGSEHVFCMNRHWHRECWMPAPPPAQPESSPPAAPAGGRGQAGGPEPRDTGGRGHPLMAQSTVTGELSAPSAGDPLQAALALGKGPTPPTYRAAHGPSPEER